MLPTIARPDLSTARKLGLTANSAASVIDPPRDYARAIGPLPEGVELCEEEEPTRALTVWFVHDAAHLDSRLREARRWAARTKLWILWRKGTKGFTQFTIRERCAGFGLVDYKACSVDATWSGMLVTRKK